VDRGETSVSHILELHAGSRISTHTEGSLTGHICYRTNHLTGFAVTGTSHPPAYKLCKYPINHANSSFLQSRPSSPCASVSRIIVSSPHIPSITMDAASPPTFNCLTPASPSSVLSQATMNTTLYVPLCWTDSLCTASSPRHRRREVTKSRSFQASFPPTIYLRDVHLHDPDYAPSPSHLNVLPWNITTPLLSLYGYGM
jgi:hypothetical protein